MRLETPFIRTFVLNCTKLRTSSNSHPPLCQPNICCTFEDTEFESIPVTRVAGIFIYRKMAICNEKMQICTI